MGDTPDGAGSSFVPKIAGVSALKGLILYAATLSFAALYVYFIVEISTATGGPPKLDSALVSAAAALAGVLGSAFALEVGLTTAPEATNQPLAHALDRVAPRKPGPRLRVRKGLSFEAITTDKPSWPKTFGIWVYAIVAAAVAITYALNQSETPDMIKALAVAFAGYVLALITVAYRSPDGPAPATPKPAVPAPTITRSAVGSTNGSDPTTPHGGSPADDQEGAGALEPH